MMNRNDKFLIGMVGGFAKLVFAVGIITYLWIVKPVIFSSSDVALFIQRVILEFPALIMFLVMLFIIWATNKWSRHITKKRCTENFISHLDEETRTLISNYQDEVEKNYDLYLETKKENKKLKRELKDSLRLINNNEDFLKAFRRDHKRRVIND